MIGIDVRLARTIQLLAGPISLNLASTGTTPLYTVPAGKTLLSLKIIIVAISGTPPAPATVSIDTIAPGDVFSAQPLNGVLAANDKFTFDELLKSIVILGGNSVIANVQVSATGAQSASVYVFGKLV